MSAHADSNARLSALPPLGYKEPWKREEAEIQAAQTMVQINPRVAQSSSSYQPTPYGSSLNSGSTSATTLLPGAESHRSPHTELDSQPNSAPVKQSLPSISEALARRDENIREAPRSPGPSYEYSRRYSSPSPTRFSRSYKQDQTYERHALQRDSSQYDTVPRSQQASPRLYGPVTAGARPSSPHETFAVPTSRAAQGYGPAPPRQPSPRSTQHGPPTQSPSFAASPFVYSQRSSGGGYGAPSPHELVTSFPSVSTSTFGSNREPPWRTEDPQGLAATKLDQRDVQFSSAVKRNIDYYDLDRLLTEVYECSHNLMQFSETYRLQRHHVQRPGSIAGSTPSIPDVHHAMKFSATITESLDFVLQKLRADEADRLERESREAAERRQVQIDRVEDVSRKRAEPSDGAFTAPDPKKRRGRAAPPGRCHACNRAETPEWRRGPDGARTLCNACGLHYAKHTRKMGAQKAGAMPAGSNLRPKSAGQN